MTGTQELNPEAVAIDWRGRKSMGNLKVGDAIARKLTITGRSFELVKDRWVDSYLTLHLTCIANNIVLYHYECRWYICLVHYTARRPSSTL